MRTILSIRPRYIFTAAAGLAVMLFSSAFIELRQSQQELLHVLAEHSLTLSSAVQRSSENIVLSADVVEEQLTERLLTNAWLIAAMDSMQPMTGPRLRAIARRNGIHRINIFDASGRRVATSHEPLGFGFGPGVPRGQGPEIGPILSGDTDRIVMGFRRARFADADRFSAAVRRTRSGGGAVVLAMDAGGLTRFRSSIGIGRLITDFSGSTGIEYVVLQDRDGIIAATDSVEEMSSIESDPPLAAVLDSGTVLTRQFRYGPREVFEVARVISVAGEPAGVLRIGLSMDEMRSLEERMSRRLILMTLVLVAVGVVIVTAVIADQNSRTLRGELRRVQAETATILYSMQDIVISFDTAGRITLLNPAAERLLGITSDGAAGRFPHELSGPAASMLADLSTADRGAADRSCRDAEGSERLLSVTVSPNVSSSGVEEGRTIVAMDRTATHRLEREMRRKEKLTAMGELASGVAHEIRNPLNAISMIAQRMEREFAPSAEPQEYRELTGVLRKEARRVNAIIEQFLAFARPPRTVKESVSTTELVAHVMTLVRPSAEERGVELRSGGPDIVLQADNGQLTQALLNLLQNAVQATGAGGTVDVRISADGPERTLIAVSDTGTGIPPHQIERIFDLYYTTRREGTGIGLAVTSRIISEHGGTIEVRSEPGKGSTFTVRLPNGGKSDGAERGT